jgi:hypothetical protein
MKSWQRVPYTSHFQASVSEEATPEAPCTGEDDPGPEMMGKLPRRLQGSLVETIFERHMGAGVAQAVRTRFPSAGVRRRQNPVKKVGCLSSSHGAGCQTDRGLRGIVTPHPLAAHPT